MRFLDPRVSLYKWLADNARARERRLKELLNQKRRDDGPDAWAAVDSLHGLLGRGPIPERALRQVLEQHNVLRGES